jgi:hypothetical protein
MEHPSIGNGVEAVVRRNVKDGTVSVIGRITGLPSVPQKISWVGAAPLTRGIGFSGAGMPYPNRNIALENTPNAGSVFSSNGSFTILLKEMPAGYFSELGSTYIPPMLEFLSETDDGKKLRTSLWINDTAAPYRWISGAPASMRPTAADGSGRAMYYEGRDEMPLFDNQEAQLRARAYPSDLVAKGWAIPIDAKPWAHKVPPA